MVSGGYRRPTNPAPASGPGRLSKRTDGGPGQKLSVAPGLAYGERQQTLAQERTAPMSQADPVQPAALPTPEPSGPPTPATATNTAVGQAFNAPTARPNEPVTHGVDIGPGAGPNVMPAPVQMQQQQAGPMASMIGSLAPGDQSGVLAQLYQQALTVGA